MGEVIWDVDFRRKKKQEDDAVELARAVMGLSDQPWEIIYESNLGYVLEQKDPA